MAPSRQWNFLKTWLRKVYNKEVHEYFKDLSPLDDPDINSGRSATKAACLIAAVDSQNMALLKMNNFYYVVQKSHLKPAIFGQTISSYQESTVPYKPQVLLYFKQDGASVPNDKEPVTAEISFRLVKETHKTIEPIEAKRLATKIKNIFTLADGYKFSKGKIICTYKDIENGYQIRLYVPSDTEAVEVIKKVLSIQDHAYNDDFFTSHIPKKDTINNPGKETVYGRLVSKRRWRPTAIVRFQYATLDIYGLDQPIVLVDRSGTYWGALERT
ncbi:hypothetical protein Cri9333_1744 [Crinalium epipsammum PCC 9333]|uniref:Uncharacterized protein n=1 Tax=Crinalium epipsammum PCC 9333 TaxID=1173022 RepID=K9VYL4_9CYAN|nr:hypothetical protein [Crinalium epipsammum]AFZ12629.1 hypothetical protein Cri9333_1744 [Crinalium epipsammum PCC 9333]